MKKRILRPLPGMDLPFLILVLTLVGFGLGRGCNGCVNHDILERTERKYCICTAMLFDPADPHRAQREREARNQTKKD